MRAARVREYIGAGRAQQLQGTVAAEEPAEQARFANAESFEDVTVSIPFHRQVTVIEDSDGTGNWRVEYFDDDGACYVSSPVLKPRSVLATISRRSSSGGCEPSGLVSSA
jgi:hypothetical protein